MGNEQSGNPVRNMDKRTARREYRDDFDAAIQQYRQKLYLQSSKSHGNHQEESVKTHEKEWFDGHIRVFIRKRPIFKHEKEAYEFDVVTCSLEEDSIIIHDARMHNDMKKQLLHHHLFHFDQVFHEKSSNHEVYQATAKHLVQLACDGFYSTCMVYGQTGSGKTFTMSSIYEQAAEDIFEQLNDCMDRFSTPATVSLSFIEVAGDVCHDLLNAFHPVPLLTGSDGSVHPFPVTEPIVSNAEELLAMIKHGMGIRTTAATGVHDASSRSHAVLRIYIQRHDLTDQMANESTPMGMSSQNNATVVEGTLTLVDLAGSEHRIDSMYHGKERRKETSKINASLMALKDCIRSRAAGKVISHEYRRSKLTLALKSSFSLPTARTIVIATVSPASKDTEHSLNTLRHACIMHGQEAQIDPSTGEKETRFVTGGSTTTEMIGEINLTEIGRRNNNIRRAGGSLDAPKNDNGNKVVDSRKARSDNNEQELTEREKAKQRRAAEQRSISRMDPKHRELLRYHRKQIGSNPMQIGRMQRGIGGNVQSEGGVNTPRGRRNSLDGAQRPSTPRTNQQASNLQQEGERPTRSATSSRRAPRPTEYRVMRGDNIPQVQSHQRPTSRGRSDNSCKKSNYVDTNDLQGQIADLLHDFENEQSSAKKPQPRIDSRRMAQLRDSLDEVNEAVHIPSEPSVMRSPRLQRGSRVQVEEHVSDSDNSIEDEVGHVGNITSPRFEKQKATPRGEVADEIDDLLLASVSPDSPIARLRSASANRRSTPQRNYLGRVQREPDSGSTTNSYGAEYGIDKNIVSSKVTYNDENIPTAGKLKPPRISFEKLYHSIFDAGAPALSEQILHRQLNSLLELHGYSKAEIVELYAAHEQQQQQLIRSENQRPSSRGTSTPRSRLQGAGLNTVHGKLERSKSSSITQDIVDDAVENHTNVMQHNGRRLSVDEFVRNATPSANVQHSPPRTMRSPIKSSGRHTQNRKESSTTSRRTASVDRRQQAGGEMRKRDNERKKQLEMEEAAAELERQANLRKRRQDAARKLRQQQEEERREKAKRLEEEAAERRRVQAEDQAARRQQVPHEEVIVGASHAAAVAIEKIEQQEQELAALMSQLESCGHNDSESKVYSLKRNIALKKASLLKDRRKLAQEQSNRMDNIPERSEPSSTRPSSGRKAQNADRMPSPPVPAQQRSESSSHYYASSMDQRPQRRDVSSRQKWNNDFVEEKALNKGPGRGQDLDRKRSERERDEIEGAGNIPHHSEWNESLGAVLSRTSSNQRKRNSLRGKDRYGDDSPPRKNIEPPIEEEPVAVQRHVQSPPVVMGGGGRRRNSSIGAAAAPFANEYSWDTPT